MTKASRELYISQPALSEQIQRLESELGVELFYRKNRSLTLTIAGSVLVREAQELFAKEEELIEAVQTAGKILKRHLNIRYVPGLCTERFSYLTRSFHELHPDIMLALTGTNWNDMNDIFMSGEYDVAFYLRMGKYEVPKSEHVDLAVSNAAIVLSDRHPLASMPELHFEDIRHETFCLDIMPRKTSLKVFSLYELFENHGVRQPHILPAKNLDDIMVNISSGIAISVLSSELCGELPPGLRYVPFPDLPESSFSLYWNSRNNNPAVPVFVDFIKENFIPAT